MHTMIIYFIQVKLQLEVCPLFKEIQAKVTLQLNITVF